MSTREEFSETHVLPCGQEVTLRFIRPDDADALRAAFANLSPASRYSRFLAHLNGLSDQSLRYLTEVDGTNHVAIVATIASNDMKSERGIGVARFVRVRDEPEVAEAAITVADAHQGKGIGRLLLRALADAARARGVTTFRATMLASNAPMRAILEALNPIVRRASDEIIEVDVPLGRASDEVSDRGHPLRRLLRAAAESFSALQRLAH